MDAGIQYATSITVRGVVFPGQHNQRDAESDEPAGLCGWVLHEKGRFPWGLSLPFRPHRRAGRSASTAAEP